MSVDCGGIVFLDGGHADGGRALHVAHGALWVGLPLAVQVAVEVPAEAPAQQVQGEGVDAGAGEAEHAGQEGDDQVGERGVDVAVVEGTVQVEHVVGEPAQCKQADEHQDDLRQPLPRFHLGKENIEQDFH